MHLIDRYEYLLLSLAPQTQLIDFRQASHFCPKSKYTLNENQLFLLYLIFKIILSSVHQKSPDLCVLREIQHFLIYQVSSSCLKCSDNHKNPCWLFECITHDHKNTSISEFNHVVKTGRAVILHLLKNVKINPRPLFSQEIHPIYCILVAYIMIFIILKKRSTFILIASWYIEAKNLPTNQRNRKCELSGL